MKSSADVESECGNTSVHNDVETIIVECGKTETDESLVLVIMNTIRRKKFVFRNVECGKVFKTTRNQTMWNVKYGMWKDVLQRDCGNQKCGMWKPYMTKVECKPHITPLNMQ